MIKNLIALIVFVLFSTNLFAQKEYSGQSLGRISNFDPSLFEKSLSK